MANRVKYKNINLNIGDTIKVHYKLIEKEKVAGKTKREIKEQVRERIQVYEGIVIAIKGGSAESRMITVRRIAAGAIGMERIFPLSSPWIKKISVSKKSKVNRAKLYYLRERKGKGQEKLKEKIGAKLEESMLDENVISEKKETKSKEVVSDKTEKEEKKEDTIPHEPKK